MGQQQKVSVQISGESYPEVKPLEISLLQKRLENADFTEIDPSSEDYKTYRYLIKSPQSPHLSFYVSIMGGQFCKNKRTGYGIEYHKGEIYYQGFFQANKYHGWGITKNYEGQWIANKKCGYGKYKGSYQVGGKTVNFTYEGNWKNDKFDGLGAKNISLANSELFVSPGYSSEKAGQIDEEYIGEWLQGVKLGCGKSIKYKKINEIIKRQVYEGEFARNLYQGRGKLVNSENETFEGKFDQGNFVPAV